MIIGEAEVVIRANTAAFDGELAGLESRGSLAALPATMDRVGTDAGDALAGGIGTGARAATHEVESETSKMKAAFNDLGNKASSSLQGFGVPAALATGPGVLAASFLAVGAASLDAGAKMQAADVAIANSAQISVHAATAIGDAFLKTSGSVEYSGRQQAVAFAAIAGSLRTTEGHALSTAESMTVMKSAINLATATGNELGDATSTLAGIMQAFQIPVKGAADAANILYGAARATGLGIDQVAASVERIRGKLGALAPSFKDVATLMVDLTKNGITQRAAMSALNTSYTALAAAAVGTSKAGILSRDTLKQYGIAAVDAKGNVVSMSTIIEKLGPAFATMTKQQQLATATAIFGASSARQMTQILDAGTKSYNNASDAVAKHNAVQKAAALAGETLSGTWKKLKASVSDMLVAISTGLLPIMKDVEKVLVVLAPIVGTLLKVAFTILETAIKGVVKVGEDVYNWFKKMSVPAVLLGGIITATLIPAFVRLGIKASATFVKMAADAVVWAAGTAGTIYGTVTRWVTGQSQMDAASAESAALISASNDAIIASEAEVAGAMQTAAIAAKEAALGIGTSMGGAVGSVELLGTTAVETAGVVEGAAVTMGASFLAMIPVIGQVALAIAAVTFGFDKLLHTSVGQKIGHFLTKGGAANPINDIAGTLNYFGVGQVNPSTGPKSDELNKRNEAIIKAAEAAHKIYGLPGSGVGGNLFASKPETAAQKATAEFNASMKKVTDLFKAIPTETKSKAGSAASKAAAAALHAQNTEASEIVAAIRLPLAQGIDQLRRLGVPANRAAQVLHDAVEPFNKAVTALEKAGFNAADAVKIADAGRAEVEREAKSAAAAAKKAAAAATKSATSLITGLMVNGIEVSGSVYRAAIGAAYGIQTGGANLNANAPATVTAPPIAPPVGPHSHISHTTIAPGAVVITAPPGTDTEAFKTYVDNALHILAVEIRAGDTPTAVMR